MPLPPAPADGAAPEVAGDLGRGGGQVDWGEGGLFKFTFTVRKNGTSAYQMMCTHPAHNEEDMPACTKSRQCSLDPSHDVTLRLLKFWALLGYSKVSKKEHKQAWADQVLVAYAAGDLPSSERLDELHMIKSWAELGM